MATDTELREIQGMALDNAVEELRAADELDITSREGRGDRGFLTGMAAKSLGVAVRIEQFLNLRAGKRGGGPDDDEEQEAARRLVAKARAEVRQVMQRVRDRASD